MLGNLRLRISGRFGVDRISSIARELTNRSAFARNQDRRYFWINSPNIECLLNGIDVHDRLIITVEVGERMRKFNFANGPEFRQFMNRHIAFVFGQPSPLAREIFPIYAIDAALALQPFGYLVGLLT